MKQATLLLTAIILQLGLCLQSSAQEMLAVGGWGEIVSLNRGNVLTQSDSHVFIGAEGGIIRINKSSLEHTLISKVDGLSDAGVVQLSYSTHHELLFTIYDNANIDIVYDDRIININDILTNSNILTEKQVFDLYIFQNTAYIALDFGLVEFDLETLLFGSTMFSPFPVQSVWADEQSIYIGTEEGIYSINTNQNIADFSLWQKHATPFDNSSDLNCSQIVDWDNGLFALVNGTILALRNSSFVLAEQITPNTEIQNIRSFDDFFWLVRDCFICGDAIRRLSTSGENKPYFSGCLVDPVDVLPYPDQSAVWMLDGRPNFKYFDENEECQTLIINGPPTSNVYELWVDDGNLVNATGSVNGSFGNIFRNTGIYTRFSNQWSELNTGTSELLNEYDLRDVLGVAYDGDNEVFYFASYWSGLIKYTPSDSSIIIYDQDNSPLSPSIRDNQIRISDVALDIDNNVWVTNYEGETTLSVMTTEGEWYNFDVPYGRVVQRLAIDQNNNVYIGLRNIGLAVYNPGGDLSTTSDDRWQLIPISEDGLPNNQIRELAVDLDNTLWVGTTDGPATVNCSSSSDCSADRQIVEPRYLLEGNTINAIAIDGANRKWFGTNNGVYLIAEDNQTEVHHFTEENSPLLDDRIIDLAIDQVTGILYIATDDGISTYRSDATAGLRLQGSRDAIVFPNPVRPDYFGPISIKNLTRNAFVKITTVSGRLVHEGRARGGQYQWNARDQDGRDVSSGMYLVYSYNDQFQSSSQDGVVAKILVVR